MSTGSKRLLVFVVAIAIIGLFAIGVLIGSQLEEPVSSDEMTVTAAFEKLTANPDLLEDIEATVNAEMIYGTSTP